MLHSATDLMRYKAVVEGKNLPIADLFFNPSLSAVSHFVVGKSNMPWADLAAVSSRHSGVPDPRSRAIGLAVTEDVISDAPSVAGPIERHNVTDGDLSDGDKIELVNERASKWLQAPVSNNKSETVGHVEDFLIDWPRGRISHAVVRFGEALPFDQAVVPHSEYEVPCFNEPTLRLPSDPSHLVDAQNSEVLERVDRHWLDSLRNSISA